MPRTMLSLLIGLPILAQSPISPPRPETIEFVRIAPGEFTMGCEAGDQDCTDDEKPAHRVQITQSFEIGKYEVTQAQWQAVMGSNPSVIKGADRPVESVTRDEARDFLTRLNGRNDGYHYRLPTEGEWEYAARAGGAKKPPLDEVAWYAANSDDETHPVGQKKPNAWGLYDVLGNVREWVEDLYVRGYYSNSPVADPRGGQPGAQAEQGGPARPNGPLEQNDGGQGFGGRGRFGRGRGGRGGMRQLPIMRGGGWDNPASFVRLSARYHYYGPTLRFSDVGFRAARERISGDTSK